MGDIKRFSLAHLIRRRADIRMSIRANRAQAKAYLSGDIYWDKYDIDKSAKALVEVVGLMKLESQLLEVSQLIYSLEAEAEKVVRVG